MTCVLYVHCHCRYGWSNVLTSSSGGIAWRDRAHQKAAGWPAAGPAGTYCWRRTRSWSVASSLWPDGSRSGSRWNSFLGEKMLLSRWAGEGGRTWMMSAGFSVSSLKSSMLGAKVLMLNCCSSWAMWVSPWSTYPNRTYSLKENAVNCKYRSTMTLMWIYKTKLGVLYNIITWNNCFYVRNIFILFLENVTIFTKYLYFLLSKFTKMNFYLATKTLDK